MPAPSNDNFANAAGIVANEWVLGSNANATSETGEPANNGKTVWFVFTPQTSGLYVFSTRPGDAINIASITTEQPPTSFTNFFSKVQVFTGTAVNSLTEVTYIWNFGDDVNPGLDFADACAFNAIGGTNYYIRVDSRSATLQPVQGTFTLTSKTCPVGGTGPAIGSLNSVKFANYFPPGNYTVYYVGGAFIVANGPTWASLNWGGGSGTPDPYGNQRGFYVIYNNGANAIGFDTPATGYPTADEAQSAALGASASFTHTGGYIAMEFVDTDYSDNADGNPNPRFILSSGCGSNCTNSPTITSAVLNCTGNNRLDVFLNIPSGNPAAVYKLVLSNISGFTALNTSVDFAPISYAGGVASFYINTPPFNSPASATIELTDANGDVCSTYNFSVDATGGLEANGSDILSTENGLFGGTFGIELRSNYPCSQVNNCSVTLEATGGIVSPSATVNGVNFTGGQTTDIPFNFQTNGAETITATLNVYAQGGGQIASIQFELSANLAVTSVSSGSPIFGCGCEGAVVSVINNGLLPSYNAQVSILNEQTQQMQTVQVGVVNPGKTVNTTIPFCIPGSSCNGSSTSVTAGLKETAPGGQVSTFSNYTFNNYCGCPN